MMETRNEKYNESGGIDCEINHPVYKWIPTTLSKDDSETVDLFNAVKKNKTVENYIKPVLLESEINNMRVYEVKARLLEIDSESIRPLRAIAAGTANEFDTNKITALENERATLAAELVAFNG